MKAYLLGSIKSWTIHFNILMLTLMEFIPYAHDNISELQAYIPDNAYKTLGLILVIGNMLLRFKTNKALDQK